jgi:hypothetical protein
MEGGGLEGFCVPCMALKRPCFCHPPPPPLPPGHGWYIYVHGQISGWPVTPLGYAIYLHKQPL